MISVLKHVGSRGSSAQPSALPPHSAEGAAEDLTGRGPRRSDAGSRGTAWPSCSSRLWPTAAPHPPSALLQARNGCGEAARSLHPLHTQHTLDLRAVPRRGSQWAPEVAVLLGRGLALRWESKDPPHWTLPSCYKDPQVACMFPKCP